jgi:cell division protein ZapA
MGAIEVYILGQKYTIKGDAPEEHILHLANYVNDRIKEVYDKSPNITPLKASILAAITIADELHKVRNEEENITRSIEEKAADLVRLFE